MSWFAILGAIPTNWVKAYPNIIAFQSMFQELYTNYTLNQYAKHGNLKYIEVAFSAVFYLIPLGP